MSVKNKKRKTIQQKGRKNKKIKKCKSETK